MQKLLSIKKAFILIILTFLLSLSINILPVLADGNSGNSTNTPQWTDAAGNILWPPNRGFAGEPVEMTLTPGTRVDRYGYEGGTFVAPVGTPYDDRALAPGTETKPYNVYEVVKPVVVQSGKIAPWFGKPGGGIQYEFSQSIRDLLKSEILIKVEKKDDEK